MYLDSFTSNLVSFITQGAEPHAGDVLMAPTACTTATTSCKSSCSWLAHGSDLVHYRSDLVGLPHAGGVHYRSDLLQVLMLVA